MAAPTGKPFLLLTAVGAGCGYSLHLSYQRSHFFRWHLVSRSQGVWGGLFCTPSVPTGILPSQLCSCQRSRGSTSKTASPGHPLLLQKHCSEQHKVYFLSLGGNQLQPIPHSSMHAIHSSDYWGHVWAFKWVFGRSLKQKCFKTF